MEYLEAKNRKVLNCEPNITLPFAKRKTPVVAHRGSYIQLIRKDQKLR